MIQSPYELHKNILLDDTYGTARRLQDFVLYQYESGRYPFDINEHIGGFDRRHLQIYSDLKQWFWKNGPDPFFNEIAQIVTYSGVEGTPLSIPDKGEKAEFEHVE
ncbi:hypothetical protein HK44_020985 [Pseudomonas fluorescens HK44]|uniref:Uncharacterized protein n=1 Tax=Pseudomonas fluorescens HK44 TaxID=1042209 RepID=A0A010S5M5_PSEFL|nr:hypothetical protein HK44_020985 [Pseudomonas fluorescens HK44]